MVNKISDITTFKERIEYCKNKYQYLAKGSSRMVFDYSKTRVLKVAYNKKGIAQNQAEYDLWYHSSDIDKKLLCPIYRSCDDNTFIIQRKIDTKCRKYWKKDLDKFRNELEKFCSNYQLNIGDNHRSIGYVNSVPKIYDYGFTEYVRKHYYL